MKIIADESPHYIEFDDEGIQKVQELLKTEIDAKIYRPYIIHDAKIEKYRTTTEIIRTATHSEVPKPFTYEAKLGKRIIDLFPSLKCLKLTPIRVSLFISSPFTTYPPHRDGLSTPFGINIPISILDDGCVTSWYSDEQVKDCEVVKLKISPVEIKNFDYQKHKPEKSFSMKPNLGVLFNVRQFHGFINNSPNIRAILTMRNYDKDFTFGKAARLLLGS